MNPTVVAILEPLTEKVGHAEAENPKMTIIEYSDFQCPALRCNRSSVGGIRFQTRG